MMLMKKQPKKEKQKCSKCGGEVWLGCLVSGSKRVSWKKGKFSIGNLFGSRDHVDCYSCSKCGHLEFYRTSEDH